ncbi:hypothetical protein HGO34_08640 [Agrobacterium vitis]|uniref:Uncharacterized protein n=1 Tax=Agrobacterium vitis TaxID=373 RepID=A0AAE4WBZ9_AGRVI|nr:hypothetical protein [Agrobacterium vitis]MCF1496707.1 hypothetical protein [Allorhizobium sp. Av2]MCM2439783.1 hypothetical protein [Agrobacterium vitis]MUZ57320.1 hypothetical protein [Agrobacterium vitis]MVA65629.1 hypothetical protein [Agrobacterium vitis]MVA86654.1 hypothetical protein [Agrobacterium vitis]
MNVHVKTKPPGQAPQPADIAHFMQILSCIPDVQTACWMGTEFLAQLAPQDLQEATVALSHVHPFFLPDIDNDAAENLKLCLGRFAETVLQARLTAHRAKNLNLLLAGTPGSADIAGHALRKTLGLRSANLVTMAYSDYSASLFGANLSSKELDELALQRNGLDGVGYVAEHPVLCTPYAARQMALYGIKPIVTIRNFFVSLICTDDALMQARGLQNSMGECFFDDGLPACYQDLPLEKRLDLLVDAQAVWYAQFVASWQKCEASGQVKPLWISYEKDILGDAHPLAEKIADFIGSHQADATAIAQALADEKATNTIMADKSLPYRAKIIPAPIRDRAMKIFDRYAGDADLKSLIGE